MGIKVIAMPLFDRKVKQLYKKYPSLEKEIDHIKAALEEEPRKGIALGKNMYKIRLAVASKGKGKRSGVRVITFFLPDTNSVHLVSIYPKDDNSDLSNKELKILLKQEPNKP